MNFKYMPDLSGMGAILLHQPSWLVLVFNADLSRKKKWF